MFLLPEQYEILSGIGNVIYYDNSPNNALEWVERCSDADIICSNKDFITNESLLLLQNVLIIVPYKSEFKINKDILSKKNIQIITYSRKYKESVVEWIIGILLYQYRELHKLVRVGNEDENEILKIRKSLVGKKITILGNGLIGKHLSGVCSALGMFVTIFCRRDDIYEKVSNADIVINCLRKNESLIGFLDYRFFKALKKGVFLISVTPIEIFEYDALLNAINTGIISIYADDASSRNIGNIQDQTYQKLLGIENVLVTPHIAWMTEYEAEMTYNKMIDIIKEWKTKK
jgi:phosphoglycerate dehydrogenase-like enzyme